MTKLVIASPEAQGGPNHRPVPERIYQITTAPLMHPDGQIRQVVELAQDVTEQQRIQAQMIRAERLAAVGQLAGQVAHEVNNPIAIISAKARLLLSDRRDEMSARVAVELGKVTELSDRVARIAQGLLSYCRPSGNRRVWLDLRIPIRNSAALIEPQARRRGVRIENELPALGPVQANALEIEQVFLNLFLNALDAMPKGGLLRLTGCDAPSLFGERDGVILTVEDTGVGMPAEVRHRVFEPFFTTKQEGRGTGLGLSIALGLIRSHGGDIELESAPGQGSRFTVRLPSARTASAPAPQMQEQARQESVCS